MNYIGRDCETGEKLYQLTELGKEEAQRCGIDRADQYRCQGKEKTMNYEHDRKLASVYCSLSQQERDTWRTEQQCKKDLEQAREHIREHDRDRWENEVKDTKMSACDGSYTNSQGEICHVEVVTKNYTEEMKESKEAGVSVLGGNYCQYEA